MENVRHTNIYKGIIMSDFIISGAIGIVLVGGFYLGMIGLVLMGLGYIFG